MSKDNQPFLMLIGGASGSGKTTISKLVVERVSPDISSAIISMDDYYPNNDSMPFEERCKINYDDPSIFDYELLASNLMNLRQGNKVIKPVYSFEKHTRLEQTEPVDPCQLIILEGIYALYDLRIREMSDYMVFVDTPVEECLLRRIERDCKERGRDISEVSWRLRNHVLPMYREHVMKTRWFANNILPWDYTNERAVDGLVGVVHYYYSDRREGKW